MNKLQKKPERLLYERRGGLNRGSSPFSWWKWSAPLVRIKLFQNKLEVAARGGVLGWNIELKKPEIERVENYKFLLQHGIRIFYKKNNKKGCLIFWPGFGLHRIDDKLISILKKANYPLRN